MTSSASSRRDLVLTVMHSGDFNYIAPFVLSLKNSGFRGSTVLFASGLERKSLDKLQKCGVIVVPFRFSGRKDRQPLGRVWPVWRCFFSTGAPAAAKTRLAHYVFHLRYRRYLLYLDFLEQEAGNFDRILLADSKDIFFQADPFEWSWTSGVHFFLEEAVQRIGICRLHRLWLGCQFGESFVEQHAHRVPACSGTTFGDISSIRQYLETMIATIMSARNLAKISGGDQGIHNYLMIQNMVSNLIVHENRKGPVQTMGFMRDADLETDVNGTVLNQKGEIVPVLHQYDRLPALKARLLRRL